MDGDEQWRFMDGDEQWVKGQKVNDCVEPRMFHTLLPWNGSYDLHVNTFIGIWLGFPLNPSLQVRPVIYDRLLNWFWQAICQNMLVNKIQGVLRFTLNIFSHC